MSEIIRTVRQEEAEEFERFLERCYGHGWGFFSRRWPQLARRDQSIMDCYLVLERDGKIVSHVGTYPLDIVVGPARIKCGGIGGVATLPEDRGKGCMSRLLEVSIGRMRERGYMLSALWGDRQRYGSYGWETCGVVYNLRFHHRSFGWHKVEAAPMEEVNPGGRAALETVSRLHPTLPHHIERPHLPLQLKRSGIRMFLGRDGYLIAWGETASDLRVAELVSPTGREAGLILGALNLTCGGGADVELGPDEGERTDRLVAVMNSWSAYNQGMFRIIDWPRLLEAFAPLLGERAARAEMAPFREVVACRWQDEVEAAAVEWDGQTFGVQAAPVGGAIEMEERQLVAALLGGPHLGRQRLGALGKLLPLPLHIPSMDHV